jgi:peptidyl-prolyl cis-trans isomerase B (cyclophilin B)
MSTPQREARPPLDPGGTGPARARINPLAIAAFASSFLIGVTGIILGLIALYQIRTTGERGRWLAVAALLIGCAYVAFFAYQFLAVISPEGPRSA